MVAWELLLVASLRLVPTSVLATFGNLMFTLAVSVLSTVVWSGPPSAPAKFVSELVFVMVWLGVTVPASVRS